MLELSHPVEFPKENWLTITALCFIFNIRFYYFMKTKVHQEQQISGVSMHQVSQSEEGQRIDNFLLRCFKGVPKGHIYRLLRTGQVRVNSGRVKPAYRLVGGDQVRIPPLTWRMSSQVEISAETATWLKSRILYEHEDFLVFNKPAGYAVHAGTGLDHGLIDLLKGISEQALHWELAHRLDRETSGCLLIAKTRRVAGHLHQMFRDGQMNKRYVALVAGQWQGGERSVDAPLRKNQLHGGERMVMVDDQGRPALTDFSPLEVYADCSLLEAKIATGRTHQIRVHAAYCGHPVIGDRKYGEKTMNKTFKMRGLKRLFLHAQCLQFFWQQPIKVTAPLEEDLQQVLGAL